MSISRGYSPKHRKEKLHDNLIEENKKLIEDVNGLTDALNLHHELTNKDSQTVHGLIRNELGASRWQYGGKGKLTTYKTGGDSVDPDRSTPQTNSKMSRPASANIKKPNKTIEDLEKLKSEIDKQRAILEEKYHLSQRLQKDIRKDKKHRQANSKSLFPNRSASAHTGIKNGSKKTEKSVLNTNDDLNDSLFDTDYLEIEDRKDRVLNKINTKVIHRSGSASAKGSRNKSPPKKPDMAFGTRIEKKVEKTKPTKNSKVRNFRKAEPATVINDLQKNVISENISNDDLLLKNCDNTEPRTVDSDLFTSQKYLSEPHEEVLGLSRALSKIKTEQERDQNREFTESSNQNICVQSGENVYDQQKLNDLLKSDSLQLNLNFTRNSIDRTDSATISKQSAENQTFQNCIDSDTTTSDYSSDTDLIPDNSVPSTNCALNSDITKLELHGSVLSQIPEPKSSESEPLKISNAFEKESMPESPPPMESRPRSGRADRFVKAWVRKLGIQDVQRIALIFAKHNIGMSVMKYVTEDQVNDMGFSSLDIINKILQGIQTLKLTSSSKSMVSPKPTATVEDLSMETIKLSPNTAKRQSRREKCKEQDNQSTAIKSENKAKPLDIRGRSASRNRNKPGERDPKILVRPRSSSRSSREAQKKAEATVAAAAQKKIDKERRERRRDKEREKLLEKQKQHRDLLAAKHQEREIQKAVVIPTQDTAEPEIFNTDYEDLGSATTGRSTALENYLISSRMITPKSSQRSKDAVTQDASARPESDISPDRVRSMIETLLSSDHLQDRMTLNLVKNLQKQLEDVENRIQQKQEQINSKDVPKLSDTPLDLLVSGENVMQTPIPTSPVDEIYRCNSEVGIWDPNQATDLLSEILPSATRPSATSSKTVSTDTLQSQAASDVTRPKGTSFKSSSVASMSMSKRALLDEIHKEKDEHRKQIRHLQSELTRLQHKDPVKKSEIPKEDIIYNESDLIGEGAFSKVYRGFYQAAEVAVKKLKIPLNAQDQNYFAAEVSLLRDLRHPRVVMLLGVCTETKLPIMVLEYLSKGNLYSILHDATRSPLDHVEFYQISRDIAAGMVYLHNNRPPVLHLDLKSMNVLIDPSNRAKIADFGFSKLKHEADLKAVKAKQIQGSPAWMAPELLLNGDITVKADVYSFGIILWEMLTRKHPYEGCSMFQILERVRLNKRPEIPDHCPKQLKDLIEKCWHHNPGKRLIFKETLNIMENLSFPKEWRALFAEAGIPSLALNDIHSTRNIISLVNSTLESAKLQKMVQEYQLSIEQDDSSSQVSISDGLSEDSLDDDDLGVVTSEDSFEKIVVDSKFNEFDSENISRKSKEDKVPKKNLNEEVKPSSFKSNSFASTQNNAMSDIPRPSPRKLVKSAEASSRKLLDIEKHSVSSNSGNVLRKSKEAWSLSEELKLDLQLSPDITDAPPRLLSSNQVNHPVAPPPPPPPPPALSTSAIRPKTVPVMKDLKKELIRRKDKKQKTPVKSNQSSKNRFEVNVSALQEQRKTLKPTSQPHASQMKNLDGVPREALSSIAEILKKAMTERRFAIGEVNASTDAADWSYHSEVSQ